MRVSGHGTRVWLIGLLLLTVAVFNPVRSAAQSLEMEVEFSSIACARTCTALIEIDGYIYAGLLNGGVFAWNLDDPDDHFHITTTDGLSDPHVQDLAWTGRHLWAATKGGGLTRIDLATSPRGFRPVANIGDLDVAHITGYVQGDVERVYYSIPGGGVGLISGVQPGDPYTTANSPELASNEIHDLVVAGNDLWVGTDLGVSVLSDNAFRNVSAGLANPFILDMVHMEGLGLVVSTPLGVQAYDDEAGSWSDLGTVSMPIQQLVVADDRLWALAVGSGEDRLSYWDGDAWIDEPLHDPKTAVIAGGDALYAVGTHNISTYFDKAAQVFLNIREADLWREWTDVTELSFSFVLGVDIDAENRVWLGSFAGGGFASSDRTVLTQFTEVGTAANEYQGLFNNDANILDIVSTANGDIWMTQYSFQDAIASGLIRHRADTGVIEQLTPDNSDLDGKRYIRLAAHPDGPLVMMSDQEGASILIDPAQWRDADQWLKLPTNADGLTGSNILDAQFDGRDRIWFAVKLVGLVMWDINGSGGSDDELTWRDTSDDIWVGPISTVTDDDFDFIGLNSIEVDTDGTLWIGGSAGVIHLRADDHDGLFLDAEIIEAYKQKTSSANDGLLSGSARDIELDGNNDLWVAHEHGLDRIRIRGRETHVDAYTSLATFNEFILGDLYLPDIIAGLPPRGVFSLAASQDGRHMVGGTRFGAVLLDIPAKPEPSGPLDALFLWPNPFRPLDHAGLRIGGTDAEVEWVGYIPEGGARVEIYNLEGQLIYRDSHVDGDQNFWDGRTLSGQAIASGEYLVRVEYGNQIVILPLAVVF